MRILAGIVPRASHGRAIAWHSSVRQTAIMRPPIGSVLYGFGAAAPYGPCTAAYGVALAAVLLIPETARVTRSGPATLRSVFAGLAFIKRNKTILGPTRSISSRSCWVVPRRCCRSMCVIFYRLGHGA